MRLTLLAIALSLTGCAGLTPMQLSETAPNTPDKVAQSMQASESWNQGPVVREGASSVVLMTPEAIPQAIKNKKVSLELDPGASVQDVVAILGKLGVSVILADEAAGAKTFYLPRYSGTLGGLISAISRAADVWFVWHEGTIVVSSAERIGISVPQEAKLAEQLSKGLDSFGVKGSSVQWQAGMAVMDIAPSQFRKVKTYLERYTANAAVVTLQVAVVNVTLNQSSKQGVDWENLKISAAPLGGLNNLKSWQSATNASTTSGTTTTTSTTGSGTGTTGSGSGTGTGTTGTGTTTTTTTSVGLPAAAALSWAGNVLSGALFTQNFSFQGLFNYLQTYGTAETKQNVLLTTVAGNKVELKSLTQIPYVSGVGVTTTGNNTGTTTGSTNTAKADDGLTVELTPSYDAAANSVTIDLSLSIKAVVAFTELSAGNQIGKLTQPTTAERSFTDVLRLRPGQTMVVGGLTYDNVSDNKGSPVFLSGSKYESQALTVSRQSMFIVVRPTILKLGQVLTQEAGESLELMPDTQRSTKAKGTEK
jgi:type II secretory pathway component GspD/PulD (secretin)